MEDDIAEKLRRENSEQFFILVRMHLSFIIDMNTDENDSPTDKPKSFKWGFSKKSKNITSENSSKCNINPNKAIEIFLLTDENVIQLYQLIDILGDEKNLCQEGIFRRTGSLSRQQQLRKLLVLGGTILGDGSEEIPFSVHDMASVLKGMLADTPEPLLLNQNYQAYCHLAATNFSDGHLLQNCESRLIDALRLLLLLLPALDRRLARRLLMLLHQTTLHEVSNRMSSSALSTMFSPHVMCPRRLSPESLHTDSQIFSPILSFMIDHAPVLFTTPPQLAADITAYLSRRQQRRLLSPNGVDLNESVSEHTAANTIFTFVDRQMSGVADSKDGAKTNISTTTVTDTALAQLYAHIQALPESQNKRRLIKQFNRENGCGTPLQFQRAQKQKSIGQSLKKHIFNKSLMSKTVKKSLMLHDQGFGYQSIVESPTCKSNLKTITVEPVLNDTPKLSYEPELMDTPVKNTISIEKSPKPIESPEHNQSPDLSVTPRVMRKKLESNLLLTSTPQVANILLSDVVGNCSTPIVSNHIMRRGSMSPITKSTQKMPKAMQESIMTPRSRKPVIINCDPPTSLQQSINKEHSIIRNETINACDSSLTSSSSSSSRSIKNDSDFVSTDESCPSTSYCIKYKRINSAESSKIGAKFASVPYSNLTDVDFTKKKMRIFQESFSNKSKDSERRLYSLDQSDSELINDRLLETSDPEHNSKDVKTAGLTEPFRQYLQCRSILTKSPVDLSFVSESDDFVEMKIENVQNMSENKMSASLLYFLNGNRLEDSSDISNQKVLLENKSKCNSNYDTMSETLEDNINKENVSPGNKRLASQIDNIDDIKKAISTKKDKYKKSNTINNPIQDSFELNECNDYIDCNVRLSLRETNL